MSDGDAAAEENDMDLNELLESMDQEPEEPGVQEGKPTGLSALGCRNFQRRRCLERQQQIRMALAPRRLMQSLRQLPKRRQETLNRKNPNALPEKRKAETRLQRGSRREICPQRPEMAMYLRRYRKKH